MTVVFKFKELIHVTYFKVDLGYSQCTKEVRYYSIYD